MTTTDMTHSAVVLTVTLPPNTPLVDLLRLSLADHLAAGRVVLEPIERAQAPVVRSVTECFTQPVQRLQRKRATTLSLPPELVKEAERAARLKGQSLSVFLSDAIERYDPEADAVSLARLGEVAQRHGARYGQGVHCHLYTHLSHLQDLGKQTKRRTSCMAAAFLALALDADAAGPATH